MSSNRRPTVCIVLFITLLALPAIADDQEPLNRRPIVDQFAWEGPTFLKEESIEAIRALGKISHESTETISNPHGEGVIHLYRITFSEGLEIFARTFGSPEQTQVMKITITSPKWPVKYGLNVGAPASRIFDVLGEPARKEHEGLVYFGETEQVIFLTKSGMITSVEFLYYVD
jgi:hypothetical protein